MPKIVTLATHPECHGWVVGLALVFALALAARDFAIVLMLLVVGFTVAFATLHLM